jgi:hypothetical protein
MFPDAAVPVPASLMTLLVPGGEPVEVLIDDSLCGGGGSVCG